MIKPDTIKRNRKPNRIINEMSPYPRNHFDPNNTSLGFYKTCIKWCEEAGADTIKELTLRVVSLEEHQTLWGIGNSFSCTVDKPLRNLTYL